MNSTDTKEQMYTGTGKCRRNMNNSGQPYYPYHPSTQLVEAVNLAIYLQRPLLLKGEPGSGKTALAKDIALQLNLKYEAWHIKSTSRAKDGLYTYDAVKRLRDSQLVSLAKNKSETELKEELAKIDDPNNYIKLQQLGKAFTNDKRTVVLIDEIDKADIDFPNDLLLELDKQEFKVEETGEKIKAKQPPIIIITSNDEKDLSNAFLRRCLFHYVTFPEEPQLIEILESRFPILEQLRDRNPTLASGLPQKAVDVFIKERKRMENDKKIIKKVTTSELIDWFNALLNFPNDSSYKEQAQKSLEKLDNGELPYTSILHKYVKFEPKL